MRKRSTLAPAVSFRPSPSVLKAIKAWIAYQNDRPSLSEAISRLVELGLASCDRRSRQKLRAREMAGDTIDCMGNPATTEDVRGTRKHDLLNGREEFNRLRIDRPSATTRPKS